MINIVGYRPLAIDYDSLPPFANTKSLLFDGVDDYLDCGVISDFVNSSAFSISGWFYFNSVANETLFSYGGATGTQYCFTVQTFAGGNLVFVIANATNDAGNNYIQTNLSSVLTTSAWYHIACTYDGSQPGNTDKAKIYVNGAEATYGGGGGTIPSITTTSTSSFNIGRWDLGGSDRNLNSNIDEVAIFNSVIPIGDLWDGSGQPTDLSLLATPPTNWYRNGDNGAYKSPQWLIPSNENKDKVSNYSMAFDGTGNFVDLGDSDDFSFGHGTTDSPFSISAWIKIDSTSNFRIFNKYAGSINEYQFGTGGANNLQFYIFDSTSTFNYKARVYNTILNTGQWYHVAATYSGVGGTNAQDGMKIYVDGIRVDDSTVSGGSYVAMGNKTTPVYIGKLNTGYANGLIDEVSVYASELSQNDVTNIYNGGTPTTISGAISHWKLGEDSTFNGGVWTVPDAVGSNNGTSNGMLIDARVGTAPSSSNNAVSFNMDEVDRVTDVPT